MSLKALRSEIKRISEKVGFDEEVTILIVLSVVNCNKELADLQDGVGHVVDYRVDGTNVSLYFPFAEMNSDQAEELARAMIMQVITAEKRGRSPQVGIMDMRAVPPAGAWSLALPPAGVTMAEYAADQYRQILEARHERA
jgi:hypothetical protein